MATSANNINRYTFRIKDYHSIKEASIDLNGITVLAGLNGCGKSTIARWLYAFVRFSNEFDEIQDLNTADNLESINDEIERIYRHLSVITKNKIPNFASFRANDIDDLIRLYHQTVDNICEYISSLPADELSKYEEWLWKALRVENYISIPKKERFELFRAISSYRLDKILSLGEKSKSAKQWDQLQEDIENILRLRHIAPKDVEFIENGTGLITDGRFIPPFSLTRAIYIDSPMSITNQTHYGNPCWDSLVWMLKNPLKPINEDGKVIAFLLKRILGGDIEIREDLAIRQELRYHRKKDNLDIPIEDVATGMKTFAYILRLLENGYLDNQTLLIIDEPEAHLHPQWIFQFAKILVMLQTKLGVKIMVASHNPDMVAAVQAIGMSEGMEETLNFYQAVPEEDGLTYTYKSTGTSIGSIFDCFNVALDRIDSYRPQE